MKVSAVICEYNPFHNGHKYLNEAAKADCDALIAVMSTSFTQRGDTAIYSKYDRARCALKNGADMVVELPAAYAVSPAQCFAESAVAVIKGIGCVDSLVFGSECGNIQLLQKAADAIHSVQVAALVQEKMNNGLYYPRALAEAAGDILGGEIAEILSAPNDTLAVEYCRALGGSDITPIAVKRRFISHDSEQTLNGYASASHIRRLIQSGEEISEFVPDVALCDNPAFLEKIYPVILYRLRSMSRSELSNLPEVSEGLHNRIYEAVRSESDLRSAMEKIKTKRYTMARIRRIFVCALLGTTKEIRANSVPYIRVLGFTKAGERVLKNMKHTARLPVITGAAAALKTLDGIGKTVLEREIAASDIFALARENPTSCGADFTEKIIKI